MAEFVVGAAVTVTFRISPESDAIGRVTGEGGGEWRSHFYSLHTLEDVLDHWTYNALCNGVHDVRRLDGWADLPDGQVEIDIDYAGSDVV